MKVARKRASLRYSSNNDHRTPACVLAMSLVAVLASPMAFGQDEPGPLIEVVWVTVEPNCVGEWADLQRQMNAARQEAGLPQRNIWQVVSGDTSAYRIIEGFPDSLAVRDVPATQVMQPAALANWLSRVRECIESRLVIIGQTHPDLDIETEEGAQPPLAIIRTVTTKPGNLGAYTTWLGDELFPALREAGSTGHFIGRVYIGTSPRTVWTVNYFDNWADVDAAVRAPFPTAKTLDGFNFSEGFTYVQSTEMIVLRHRTDLLVE